MENKPLHFDGSIHPEFNDGQEPVVFELTDEIRKNLGANPYDLSGE